MRTFANNTIIYAEIIVHEETTIQNNFVGNNTDRITNWGDGTINNSNEHTYKPGQYILTVTGPMLSSTETRYNSITQGTVSYSDFLVSVRVSGSIKTQLPLDK